jgi:hypothetical protein
MLKETLEKTLPGGGLSLPDSTPVENKLGLALKDLSDLAAREGKVTGTAATAGFFAERGINPEDLPGSSIGQMLAFVDRAMVDPVHKRAEAVGDILQAISQERSRIQQTAMTQMNTMMSQGMWNDLMKTNKGQATELWKAAGFYGNPYSIPENTPGRWDHLQITSPFPGRTLNESHDLLHSEKAPSWFINDEILANLTDAQKREFTLVQESPAREQKSKPGFITSIEKTIGKTAQDSPDVWRKIPESRITESPGFQEYVQKEWLNARRNVGGSSYDNVGGPTMQLYNATLEKMSVEEVPSFKDENALRMYVHDVNETQGMDLSVTQINTVISKILSEGLARSIPEERIPDYGDQIYKNVSKYMKENGISETQDNLIDVVNATLEKYYKEKKIKPFAPETVSAIHEYIITKYLVKEGGGDKQKEKAKLSTYLISWEEAQKHNSFYQHLQLPFMEKMGEIDNYIRGN